MHIFAYHFIDNFRLYFDRRAICLLFLGISAGMPIMLILSTLTFWLGEAEVSRKTITMFGWAALGYSFKFIWAPLLDSMRLPVLSTLLGKRRSWLLFSQLMIALAICLMAIIDPAQPAMLPYMAWAAVLVGFSSATQDISIDAYRIEVIGEDSVMQVVVNAMYVAGYRLGMIIAGAGALKLAYHLGTKKEQYVYQAWQTTYFVMAALMAIGILTTLSSPKIHETDHSQNTAKNNLLLLLLFLFSLSAFILSFIFFRTKLSVSPSVLLHFLRECFILFLATFSAITTGSILIMLKIVPRELAKKAWLTPFIDFFQRYGKNALLLLALIGLYRLSDIVAGFITNKFYQDMGFNKDEIATAVKTFGVIMTIGGGFVGGILAKKFDLMHMMMLGAITSSATNLLFILLAYSGHNLSLLCFAVSFDNLAGGFAGTIFIAFLSALTNIRFTATQYAIFSSLMTLIPKLIGGYSGGIVDAYGYPFFFTMTAVIGIPILGLIYLAGKKLDLQTTGTLYD